jgi:hypothetical protein
LNRHGLDLDTSTLAIYLGAWLLGTFVGGVLAAVLL